jgi:hypothetical protein
LVCRGAGCGTAQAASAVHIIVAKDKNRIFIIDPYGHFSLQPLGQHRNGRK